MLAENGGPIQLNRHWAHLLLKRMNFVERKATSSSKLTMTDFNTRENFLTMLLLQLKWKKFLENLFSTGINWHQVCPIFNLDHRGERRVKMEWMASVR